MAALLVLAFAALVASEARAKCPNEAPAEPACVPLASWALPTVHGDLLIPSTSARYASAFVGAGADFTVLSWSNNVDSFGPSQGGLRVGASVLRGVGEGASPGSSDVSLITYRASTVVSFEGNASRRFLIPTFGTAIGGLWVRGQGPGVARESARAAAEASLGLYVLYTRHVVVDAQGGVFVPLSSSQALFGPKAQLTVSFSLW